MMHDIFIAWATGTVCCATLLLAHEDDYTTNTFIIAWLCCAIMWPAFVLAAIIAYLKQAPFKSPNPHNPVGGNG